MKSILFVLIIVILKAACANAQLYLSAVNTGDCVAARITAKRTAFVDELDKKYCAEHNKDKVKERECIENSRSIQEFSFFTDRCSESSYYIGINGKEVKLSRITKKPGKPINFIGSFRGNGISVLITKPRLLGKTYREGEAKIESNVLNAGYTVDVTVTKGAFTKSFKNVVLMYGL